MGKISNVTNSSDPHSIKSRVFVGCLNTFTLTKDDVQAIFDRYGSISAISMHKGYAFVQYMDEQSARNAVAGEDQRVYAAQRIDVNLSSEPKQNRSATKRPPAKEWDCFYNVPTATVLSHFPPIFTVNHPYADIGQTIPVAPPIKKRVVGGATLAQNRRSDVATVERYSCLRSKLGVESPDSNHQEIETSITATAAAASNYVGVMNLSGGTPSSVAEERTFSVAPDILICGSCKQSFDNTLLLIEHKRIGCRLRFSCKCRPETQLNPSAVDSLPDNSNGHVITNDDARQSESPLLCATCRECFTSWRRLCAHCQSAHSVSIYLQSNTLTAADNTNNPTEEKSLNEQSFINSTKTDSLTH